jgi:hypothetical protein
VHSTSNYFSEWTIEEDVMYLLILIVQATRYFYPANSFFVWSCQEDFAMKKPHKNRDI